MRPRGAKPGYPPDDTSVSADAVAKRPLVADYARTRRRSFAGRRQGVGLAATPRHTPEIIERHIVAGGFDYLIKARVSDMAAYRAFLGGTLVNLPGVRETRTYAVLEEVKSTVVMAV